MFIKIYFTALSFITISFQFLFSQSFRNSLIQFIKMIQLLSQYAQKQIHIFYRHKPLNPTFLLCHHPLFNQELI
jgi:hypothetical protein